MGAIRGNPQAFSMEPSRWGLSVLLLLLGLLGAVALARPIGKPVDDTARIPDYAVFAARLSEAVKERDGDYIRSLMLPETEVGAPILWLRDETLKNAERTKWLAALDDPAAPFWTSMERYLRWGVRWDETQQEACYPSFEARPGTQFGIVITGASVNVRAAPGRSARVLTTLSWELLETRYPGSGPDPGPKFLDQGHYYTKIRLADGRVGYVSNDFVWMYPGWEGSFGKVDGEWKLLRFIQPGC